MEVALLLGMLLLLLRVTVESDLECTVPAYIQTHLHYVALNYVALCVARQAASQLGLHSAY